MSRTRRHYVVVDTGPHYAVMQLDPNDWPGSEGVYDEFCKCASRQRSLEIARGLNELEAELEARRARDRREAAKRRKAVTP